TCGHDRGSGEHCPGIRGRYAVDRLIDDVILEEHRVPTGSLGSHHELDQRPRVRIGAAGREVEAVSHQRSTLCPWSVGPLPRLQRAPPRPPPPEAGGAGPPERGEGRRWSSGARVRFQAARGWGGGGMRGGLGPVALRRGSGGFLRGPGWPPRRPCQWPTWERT